jgi:uncharacterized membrane protein YeaQ/YmgE (transglycosylase-associated protein family)
LFAGEIDRGSYGMLFLSAAATVGEIVALIVVGLIVGALGRLIHPGHDPIGLLATTLIGIASVLVVGLLLRGPLGYLGYAIAIAVAVLLVALISGSRRSRTRRRH